MLKLPSLSFLWEAFTLVLRRFPAAFISAILGTGAALWMIQEDTEPVLKVFMLCLMGLPLFTALHTLGETSEKPDAPTPEAPSVPWRVLRYWGPVAAGLLFLVAYSFFLYPRQNSFENGPGLPRYFGLLVVAHLAVAVAPYLNRRGVEDFWEYNKQLFANFIVGAAYTLILFAGLALAIVAVDRLFNLNIAGESYARLFIVLAGIFNTIFFLYHFPADYRFEDEDRDYNQVFKNLCEYILIPIVGLYFLILYAYSAKILFTWTLPKGWVSSLVIGFSVAGIFTYLLNYLLPQYRGGQAVRVYRRWFWWVLLPMTGLLFVAISRRLTDYGITEPRYLVTLTGIWLLVTSIYFLFSKSDNIKFIPISLAIFTLWGLFGPYNAFSASEQSQLGLLKSALLRNGRWENGKMTPGKTTLTGEEALKIHSKLEYFTYHHHLSALKPYLPEAQQHLADKDDPWRKSQELAEWLKIGSPANEPSNDRVIVVSGPTGWTDGTDVAGFTRFYWVKLDPLSEDKPTDQGRYLILSEDGRRLEWREKRGSGADLLLASFDLNPLVREWKAVREDYVTLIAGTERYDLHSSRVDALLVVRNATLGVDDKGSKVSSLEGVLFLKEKPVPNKNNRK